jgi:hypothetical protein
MQAVSRKRDDDEGRYGRLEEHFEAVADAVHPSARQLIDFWRQREAGGGFVVGRDVPSCALKRVLYNLALFEPIEEDGKIVDFRARLAGDGLRLRFGRDIAGERMSKMFSRQEFDAHLARTLDSLARGEPALVRSELRRGTLVERRLEVVVLPVWNQKKTERWVLVGIFYFG